VAFRLPQDQYRDPSSKRQDEFDQQLNHVNGPPFRFDWKARTLSGLSSVKHPEKNPLFQPIPEKETLLSYTADVELCLSLQVTTFEGVTNLP